MSIALSRYAAAKDDGVCRLHVMTLQDWMIVKLVTLILNDIVISGCDWFKDRQRIHRGDAPAPRSILSSLYSISLFLFEVIWLCVGWAWWSHMHINCTSTAMLNTVLAILLIDTVLLGITFGFICCGSCVLVLLVCLTDLIPSTVPPIDSTELPQVILKKGYSPTPGDDHTSRPICLEKYVETAEVGTLSCKVHRFHVPCIESWLKLKGDCPECRARALPIVAASAPVAFQIEMIA